MCLRIKKKTLRISVPNSNNFHSVTFQVCVMESTKLKYIKPTLKQLNYAVQN